LLVVRELEVLHKHLPNSQTARNKDSSGPTPTRFVSKRGSGTIVNAVIARLVFAMA
jgi:hypothetical protein